MSDFVYNDFAPLIDEELIQRVKRLSTANLCDGMKGLGIDQDGCVDAEIMPIDASLTVVGTAFTIHTSKGNNYPIHVGLYDDRVKPGYVMVVAGEAATESCYLGDLIASTAKALGLEGIVVDGYVRDKIGLTQLEYPIFSRGFKQRSPSKIEEGEINSRVVFGGVAVNPGDLIVGDADGITVVPRDRVIEVIEAAEKKVDYEEKRRVVITECENCRREGKPLPQIAPQWVLDMQNK